VSRIVVVEDDNVTRRTVARTLEALGGHQVRGFAGGEEALREAAAFAPELLVLDVSMPGMDGPATLRAMREVPQLARVPAVFLTASTQAAQVGMYRELGAVDVIAKPFDPGKLVQRIAAALASPREPASPDSRPVALVVEDDPGIRYLLRFILEQQGWSVREAADGPQGLHAVLQGEIADAVLLDIMLPGVDGLALLDTIRAGPRWMDVPVMMLTANGDEASIHRALAAGAADYLVKPFDPADFVARLQRLPRRPR
jgi:two-component system, OmpR family, response regulator